LSNGSETNPRIARNLADYLADASTVLPEPIDAEEAVAMIAKQHQENGGATFNLYFGDQIGQQLYAVSVYVERGVRRQGRALPIQFLKAFFKKNSDLLQDPRNSIGCWFDPETGRTYLDISATLPNRQAAINLGLRYNQISIYDLAHDEVISTEGTGEETTGLPPESQRLPAVERG